MLVFWMSTVLWVGRVHAGVGVADVSCFRDEWDNIPWCWLF